MYVSDLLANELGKKILCAILGTSLRFWNTFKIQGKTFLKNLQVNTQHQNLGPSQQSVRDQAESYPLDNLPEEAHTPESEGPISVPTLEDSPPLLCFPCWLPFPNKGRSFLFFLLSEWLYGVPRESRTEAVSLDIGQAGAGGLGKPLPDPPADGTCWKILLKAEIKDSV